VLARKVNSYGDPRLYSLAQLGKQLANSSQPLVPQQVFMTGSGDGQAASGTIGTLLSLLLAERSGFALGSATTDADELNRLAARYAEQALTHLSAGGESLKNGKTPPTTP
jgi:hypothetical protein